jgi:hypothetical protein
MARILVLAFLLLSVTSFGQVREVPTIVKDEFAKQYPEAENIEYEDNLVSVKVHFSIAGEKMVASYTNKAKWKETEKEWTYEQLNDDIKLGFDKSKYAEWKVLDTKVIYRPGNITQYRVKVEKNDIQKKHLFFNKAGRLVGDAITL